jgi:hypothetical protein
MKLHVLGTWDDHFVFCCLFQVSRVYVYKHYYYDIFPTIKNMDNIDVITDDEEDCFIELAG